MSEIFITDADGKQSSLQIKPGLSLMEHLRDADFDEVQAICGGCCSCATCHVHIQSSAGDIPAMEENEEALLELEDSFDSNKSRLSCQIELDESHHGLRVVLLADEF